MDQNADIFPAYRLVAQFADGQRLTFDGLTEQQAQTRMEAAQALHGDICWYDGVTDQHYCPFYGRCDWQGIARALREIGFAHDLTFEVASFARGLPRNMIGPALQVCQAAGETLLHMIQQDE